MEYRVVSPETAKVVKGMLKFVSDATRPVLAVINFDAENMMAANGFVINLQKKPVELADLVGKFKIGIIGRMPGGINRVLVVEEIKLEQAYPDIYFFSDRKPADYVEVTLNCGFLRDVLDSMSNGIVKVRIESKNSPVIFEDTEDHHLVVMPLLSEKEIRLPARPKVSLVVNKE